MASSDVIVDTFTELAPHYEESMDRELYELWGLGYGGFVDHIVKQAPLHDGDIILDVATGTAKIPLAISNSRGGGCRIVGLDITPAMLQSGLTQVRAESVTPPIDLICGSAMVMPFADGAFDVIICGLGMHHMDLPLTIANMRRKLRERGRILLITVGAPRLWRIFPVSAVLRAGIFLYYWLGRKSSRAWAEAAAVSNIRTADEWRQLLSDSGFADIEIRADFTGRHFWYPNSLTIKSSRGT